MKLQVLLIAFLVSTIGVSQVKKQPKQSSQSNGVKISSLAFSIETKEDYKTINWKDVKEIFSHNTNKEEEIEMTFKYALPNSKSNIKGEIKVHGNVKDIDVLISKAKKGLKGLIKIVDNNQ